jgi:tetratricopeptide (TPR) repeat protein
MADAADHVAYAGRLRANDRRDAAAAHYERALSLDPDHADAHAGYATLLAADDPATAEHHYRAALDLTPDDPGTHSDYGVLLYEERRLWAARDHLERAVDLWLTRDRQRDALRDVAVLVRIDHRLDRPTAALARWRDAMRLRETTEVDQPLDRSLRALGTVLTARGAADRVRDAVALGVEHLGRGEFQQAIHLFQPAWDEHDRLRVASEARADARCAGAALAGFHRVAGNTRAEAALVAELRADRADLSAGPRAVYDRLVGVDGRGPAELRRLATGLGDGDESSDASARLFAFADLLELVDGS